MRFSRFLGICVPAAMLLAACARQPITTTAATAATASKLPPSKAPGHFLATPPVIDGQTSDWTDSLQYDANTKLQYQVLNDNRTVYVRLKAADAPTQAKMAYLGLVVWLDTTGRNQQQLGIRYPLGVDLNSFKPAPERPAGAMGPSAAERQAEHLGRLREAVANANEMELLNYKGSKEPTLTDAQSQLGVKAAVAVDAQNNLIYELAVPMRLLYRRLPALASGQPAVVGVWLAGMKPKLPPGSSNNSDYNVTGSNSMGGGMGGMRGGYGGGGYGGGMRGGGMRGGGGGSGFTPLTLKTSAPLLGK
ncbi:hypothetical protein [Hymenobacter ginkgonis]|uniref:hypothetical protein n=1 Tax=Hymenobacter ginkgonis TaxID=2682976 RepID=UPI0018DE764E|nr:hypothetical protein [Hymenobacter ginkgonis]